MLIYCISKRPFQFFKPLAITFALITAGCASLPAEKTALPPIKPIDLVVSDQTLTEKPFLWPAANWWTNYGDTQLDMLMQEALQNSPDLVAATARLTEAASLLGLSRSANLPDISLNASASQQKLSYNDIIPPAFLPNGWNDFGAATLNFQWDLDFWGRNRAALAAATSEYTARRADLAQARLMLTSYIAANYADLERLYQNLDTAEKSKTIRAKTLELFKERNRHGLENMGTVREAEARLAVAESKALAISEQISLKRNQLGALLGKGPARGIAIKRPELSLTATRIPETGLSLNLLGQRPDIISARLRAEAQQQRVKSSKAAFYPNVNLTAFIGYNALGLDRLIETDSYAGNVGPAIHLPIFNGGRLRSQLRGEKARYEMVVANYNNTVIHALQDVADILTSQRALSKRIAKAEEAVNAAQQAHTVAKNRYKGGLANYLQVLSAEDVLLASTEALINLQASALALDVQLNRALGGGTQVATSTSDSRLNI